MERVPFQWIEHELPELPATYMREREAYLHATILGVTSKGTDQDVNVITPIALYGHTYATMMMLSCKKARPARQGVVADVLYRSQNDHQGALGAINSLSRHISVLSVLRAYDSFLSTHVAYEKLHGGATVSPTSIIERLMLMA